LKTAGSASSGNETDSLLMKESVIIALLIWNMMLTILSFLFCYLHANRLQYRIEPDKNVVRTRLTELK
jgi:hypothetical protein